MRWYTLNFLFDDLEMIIMTIDELFLGKLCITYKDVREFFKNELKTADEPIKEYIYKIMPIIQEIKNDEKNGE